MGLFFYIPKSSEITHFDDMCVYKYIYRYIDRADIDEIEIEIDRDRDPHNSSISSENAV